MNWLKNLFHRHTFNPAAWEEYKVVSVCCQGDSIPKRRVYLWKNTCLTCGQLVFKKTRIES